MFDKCLYSGVNSWLMFVRILMHKHLLNMHNGWDSLQHFCFVKMFASNIRALLIVHDFNSNP